MAQPSDASLLMELHHSVYKTSQYHVTQYDEAKEFVTEDSITKRINTCEKNKNDLMILAFHQDQLIAVLDFFSGYPRRRTSHKGTLGMSVHGDWQGQGVGKQLIHFLIGWLKSNSDIEFIKLEVVEPNVPAVQLYKNFGFKEIGIDPFGIKREDQNYYPLITMSLRIQ